MGNAAERRARFEENEALVLAKYRPVTGAELVIDPQQGKAIHGPWRPPGPDEILVGRL